MMLGWLILAVGLLALEGLGAAALERSGLTCKDDQLLYVIPKSQIGDAAPNVTVLDKKGMMRPLLDDLSCRCNLTEQADGSVIIAASYDGCCVGQKNDSFVMVIMISYKDDYGAWKIPEKQEVKCQFRPAMDAPSPSQCATIDRKERLLCGDSLITSDQCQNRGCCYDPSDYVNTCYYGNKVTVQCTSDGTFSVAISKYATLPYLFLESVRLTRATDQNCAPLTKTDSFLLFQFPLSACGTTAKVVGNMMIYENELRAKRAVQTWQGSVITRDSTFRLTIQCRLSSDSYLPLNMNVFTLAPPDEATSQGPLKLELRIAKDLQYTDYFMDSDYPIVKILRDPVFVEVRILRRTDPALVLLLQQCWATPTSDPFDATQWPLLLDGCPFTGDNYGTIITPVDTSATQEFQSYYVRFIVNTFTFVDPVSQPLTGQVYFHCSGSVCVPSTSQTCSYSCTPTLRPKKHVLHHHDMNMVSSHGPVAFNIAMEKLETMNVSKTSISMMDLRWVGIAAVLGVLGVAVVAVGFWVSARQRQNLILDDM